MSEHPFASTMQSIQKQTTANGQQVSYFNLSYTFFCDYLLLLIQTDIWQQVSRKCIKSRVKIIQCVYRTGPVYVPYELIFFFLLFSFSRPTHCLASSQLFKIKRFWCKLSTSIDANNKHVNQTNALQLFASGAIWKWNKYYNDDDDGGNDDDCDINVDDDRADRCAKHRNKNDNTFIELFDIGSASRPICTSWHQLC